MYEERSRLTSQKRISIVALQVVKKLFCIFFYFEQERRLNILSFKRYFFHWMKIKEKPLWYNYNQLKKNG